MKDAVIEGRYVDLKFIRTRSVCQIVIEAPIEHGEMIVQALGSPLPAVEVPVAIARLRPGATAEKAEKADKPRRRWDELTCAQQAGIRCEEPAFLTFLNDENLMGDDDEDAADAVRRICEVSSRAELDRFGDAKTAWRSLDDHYQAWLRVAA